MSALRTALAGLLLGALGASVLQACDPGGCSGQGECPTPQLVPFLSGTYRGADSSLSLLPAPEPELTLSLDEARARVTERYAHDGHTYETQYEVLQIRPENAMHGGVPLAP
ncbi:hypothetical protein FGE12_12975 [Aggregicoccus sp. 17bor-14]|uniref:hypothetical protein n=1 Tax=Myxococcaceae TaxID=31 RepID=UPI00129CCFA7|nr:MULTISPECIES: hypothetical protein [Myxococcaceae]MBF5043304.1 hypothetical protein [Simulacricoccus sp. 17bor-14]MRI89063.1 hypothetical protein [Aggregicoccus sp. 17bor-14]